MHKPWAPTTIWMHIFGWCFSKTVPVWLAIAESRLNLNINTPRTVTNGYVNSKRPNETECRHYHTTHQLYIGYDNRSHTAYTAHTAHSSLAYTDHFADRKLSRARIALKEEWEKNTKYRKKRFRRQRRRRQRGVEKKTFIKPGS